MILALRVWSRKEEEFTVQGEASVLYSGEDPA
jgi:hypothetical protein